MERTTINLDPREVRLVRLGELNAELAALEQRGRALSGERDRIILEIKIDKDAAAAENK